MNIKPFKHFSSGFHRTHVVRSVRKIPRKSKPTPLLRSPLIIDKEAPKVLESISSISNKKQNNRVFVIGGGPSLKFFNLANLRTEDTICVNSSVFDVPAPNFFITKDYTFLINYLVSCLQTEEDASKKWNNAIKIFVACFVGGALQDIDGRIVDVEKEIRYDLHPVNWIVKNDKQKGIGLSVDDFRCGIDSGYGALQLAILLKYKEVYLLGYDMCVHDQTHYHGRYGERKKELFQKKLDGYFKLYREAIQEIREKTRVKVFSCSPTSRLNELIPYVSIEEVLR